MTTSIGLNRYFAQLLAMGGRTSVSPKAPIAPMVYHCRDQIRDLIPISSGVRGLRGSRGQAEDAVALLLGYDTQSVIDKSD